MWFHDDGLLFQPLFLNYINHIFRTCAFSSSSEIYVCPMYFDQRCQSVRKVWVYFYVVYSLFGQMISASIIKLQMHNEKPVSITFDEPFKLHFLFKPFHPKYVYSKHFIENCHLKVNIFQSQRCQQKIPRNLQIFEKEKAPISKK